MLIELKFREETYSVDLSQGKDISITLYDGKSPKAFHAPDLVFSPLEAGSFIGSLEAGSPVNFYDIKINPHGNSTHTESARHIDSRSPNIGEVMTQNHFVSVLLTIPEYTKQNEDLIIDMDTYNWDQIDFNEIDAIVLRTLPNEPSKKYQDYSDTNPPYMDSELISFLSEKVDHLLIDLPSVDKEKDEGLLLAHKAFWRTETNPNYDKTITELIYVDSSIEDGIYLLEIQTLPLALDVSPSKPILYSMIKK